MKKVLNTKNDTLIRKKGLQLLENLENLADERNLATHTMWTVVMPEREIRPHPMLPPPKKGVLNDDVRAQFTELTTKLRDLFAELWQYEPALGVHLEQRNSP
jgi:hypothetical protein